MDNKLPKGWEIKKLVKQIPIVKTGVKKYKGEKFYYSTGAVNTTSISPEGKYNFNNKPSRANRLIVKGDVVQARMQGTNKALIIDKNIDGSLFSTGFLQFRPSENNYDSKLFYHYICSDLFLKQRDEFASGSTQIALTDKGANKIDLVVPPKAQQKRISDKLDVLLVRVKNSQFRLEKIPKILKRFRQSVLSAACSGRLTAGWLRKNTNNITVDSIIEAIHIKRKEMTISASQKEKIKQIYSQSEENDSENLPENWRYITLNKLCLSFDYGTSAKSQSSGIIPVLRMGNVQNGEINWSDLVFTSNNEEIKKYILEPNTVLFNRTNSPKLVGKTAIYRGEKPAIFAGYLIRINPFPELDAEYINICLNTDYAREFCSQVKTDGVSQSNINAQKLGKFEVPFCLIEEQKEIVKRVKALFVLADKIEARYLKAKGYFDKLTPSLLAKAFRGELVPQDPSDESTIVLLKRTKNLKEYKEKM